ncbi:MAG: hypothetical protein L7G96_02965 [Vulcanisaeta sp.]|nr:hypothetical protein [Vulcanisaeta sp.]
MRLLRDFLLGILIFITGILTFFLLYPLAWHVGSGFVAFLIFLMPFIFGIAGLGWYLGEWFGVGSAIRELMLRLRVWLLWRLLPGDREFLMDLVFIEYVLGEVYRLSHELLINGNEVTIRINAPISKDLAIRLMNQININLNKLIVMGIEENRSEENLKTQGNKTKPGP